MKIHADEKDSGKYYIHDLKHNCLITNVVSADDEVGEYEAAVIVMRKYESFEEQVGFVHGETVKVKCDIKILSEDNEEDLATIKKIKSIDES